MSDTLQYLIDARGERTAVVLPISDYEKLLEALDSEMDSEERRADQRTKRILRSFWSDCGPV